jgi:RNA polymerase sigma factor (sigma-70 family)
MLPVSVDAAYRGDCHGPETMDRTHAGGEAVGALYVEHSRWLQGWLQRRLGDVHGAADLTHDTFLSILKAQIGRCVLDGLREPRAYLTTVAKGLLVNRQRRLALEQAWLETLAVLPQAMAPSPEEEVLILEALNELDALFDAMPPVVRVVFLHSQVDGLSYAEIAGRLDISLRTVKRHMARAFELCLSLMS